MIRVHCIYIFILIVCFTLDIQVYGRVLNKNDTYKSRQQTINDLLLNESFETPGAFPPAGWTYVNGIADAYWEQNNYYAYHEEHSARAHQGYASDYQADEWLLTPPIDFDDRNDLSLVFFGFSSSAPDGVRENMRIMAVDQAYENTTDLHNHAELIEVIPFTSDWEEYIVDLSNLSGEKHLAFHYYVTAQDQTSFNWIYIDYVRIGPFAIHTLTMEYPAGAGNTNPPAGQHEYTEDLVVELLATPDYGWDFSHWEGDVIEPLQMLTFIQMDEDKSVKAHFVPLEPTPTPFYEDFLGVATGNIPVGWTRSHINWGAWPTNNAEGERPEMRFHWNPAQDDELLRLTSRPINAVHESSLTLSFKHFVNDFMGLYLLKVQSSTDTINWENEWVLYMKSAEQNPDKIPERSEGKNHGPENVSVNLDHLAGKEKFYISFVFEGNNSHINSWFIDDLLISGDEDFFKVYFQVTCMIEDTPLPDVLITFDENDQQLITNLYGQAQIMLKPGHYTAYLDKEGYQTKEKSFEVIDSEMNVGIAMEPVEYLHNLIINVNMKDAIFGEEQIVFDPQEGHSVYISGNFTGEWPIPGEDPEMQLHPRDENPNIYTNTIALTEGLYEYKYFVVINNIPGWDHGEWEGEPNRQVEITGPLVVSDIWGDYPLNAPNHPSFNILVYPNPAGKRVFIDSSAQISQVIIMDAYGRVVARKQGNKKHIAIGTAHLPAGFYILQVQTRLGTTSQKIQIIGNGHWH